MYWRIAAFSFVLLLSACGFHLRGDAQISAEFSPLYVEPGELTPQQLRQVRDSLSRASVMVAETAQGANRLNIQLTTFRVRDIAKSNVSDVLLLQLGMSLQYSIQNESEQDLVPLTEITQTVGIELDNNNVLSHSQLQDKAQQSLQRRLIESMIFQLGHV
jgi:LPS-assembly lipoprotein